MGHHSKLPVEHALENPQIFEHMFNQMFETAKILEESVTEPCLVFSPADFEYNAITAWDNEWSTKLLLEYTFSEHQTSWCEYHVKDLGSARNGRNAEAPLAFFMGWRLLPPCKVSKVSVFAMFK